MYVLASGAKTELRNQIAIAHATNDSSRGASVKKNGKSANETVK